METAYFRKVFALICTGTLLVLSFLIIKPIIMSIFFGLVLAFVFSPIYNFFYKVTKSPNLSATLICLLLILIILLPIWFFTPTLINQTFNLYLSAQQIDYTAILKQVFPSLFASEQFTTEFGGMIQSFVIKGGNYLLDSLSKFILNFPLIALHSFVILFTLYFSLRDKKELISYVKSLSPFSKEVEDELFKSSRSITASVLYGNVVVGIIQGITIGIGFFIFGIPNALFLTILGVIVGILPLVGTFVIWFPVLIYLLVVNNMFAAIGILIFGIISTNVDSLLRSAFVSRFTKVHSGIILIGMIGGPFVFGVLGVILGPLILSYLLIIFDVFRSMDGKEKKFQFLVKRD
jgi:predicted PurR-regulated permease PerM